MPTHPPRICAVITSKTCREARASLDLAAQKADIAELRLDYLTDFDFSNPESLAPILEGKRLPVIITCRIPDEGGFQIIDDSIRLPLLIEGAKRFADYCDIEASRYQQAANQDPDESKLILSWHNFTETPADIEQKYTEIVKLPAAVHKLATRANDISDVLPIFRLLDRAQSKNRNLIALAMGPRGLITRILGPSRGAFLTYASIEAGAESAPGQITLDDLNSVFRLRTLKDSTRIAGVIGAPVGHSASPAMHNSAFASFGINAVYLPLEVRDLEAFFRRFVRAQTREFRWEPLGFSVTIPHKIAVVGLLDEIDETARAIGAVNTVVVREGRLLGYNTDAEGATLPLEAVTPLAGRHCALIGAGGSA
ncbi:MAG TPA: type I 3-dehydroquinate dehydratase, partial [Blastocatellia bacterium]|nr:type I 3-dehydroquinate dehydratase [Blastocatellia bacterium]